MRSWLLGACLTCMLTGCMSVRPPEFHSNLTQQPEVSFVENLDSPFLPLDSQERSERWGEELVLGQAFARRMDLYRAVTSFKSALILLPGGSQLRQQQLEYSVILAYYLGGRFQDAVDSFEGSSLTNAKPDFPAYRNLLILLHDAYERVGRPERMEKLLTLTERHSEKLAERMDLGRAVRRGDIDAASRLSSAYPVVAEELDLYQAQRLSPRNAQLLNAALPGAGYWYTGQKQTAVTALLINAAFIAAAVHFFCDENYGAGAVTTSLELGWYIGGIDGAGRAAVQYNEHLYSDRGNRMMSEERLYPLLMFEYGF